MSEQQLEAEREELERSQYEASRLEAQQQRARSAEGRRRAGAKPLARTLEDTNLADEVSALTVNQRAMTVAERDKAQDLYDRAHAGAQGLTAVPEAPRSRPRYVSLARDVSPPAPGDINTWAPCRVVAAS